MVIKIINSVLILFAVYMGLKHGWAMAAGKADVVEMFGKWGMNKFAVACFGVIGIASAVMMLVPKTFLWGNFLMATGILLITCFHLLDRDLKGVAIEVPFFLLSLVIIYLRHPLAKP